MPSRYFHNDLTLAEELVELYPDAVLVVDRDGRCTHANAKACALLRTPSRELRDRIVWTRLKQIKSDIYQWQLAKNELLDLQVDVATLSQEAQWLRLRLPENGEPFALSVQSLQQAKVEYDQSPGLVAVVDRQYRYTSVNAGYPTWFGLESHDVVGRHVRAVVGDEAFAHVRPYFDQAFDGHITGYNGIVQYKSGSKYVQAHYVPVRDASDQVHQIVITVTDLTQHKAIEEAYSRSEERYERSLEAAGVGSCDWDLKVNKFNFNNVGRSLYGFENSRNISFAEVLDRIHPEDRSLLNNLYNTACAGAPVRRLEYRILTPQGNIRWISCRSRLVVNGAGEPERLSKIQIDITDRKIAEREREELLERERKARSSVERERQRLVTMIDQAPAGILLVRGEQFVIDLINPVYQELIGNRFVLGLPFREAFPELASQGHYQVLESCYQTGLAWSAEDYPTVLEMQDGSQREVFHSVRMQPIRDQKGRVESILVFGYDVTPWVRARQQLESNERSLLAIEEDLRTQHQLLKGITDNTESALFMMDEFGFATFMNPAAERITGFTLEELKDRPLHDYVHGLRPDGTSYPIGDCPLGKAYKHHTRVPSGEEIFLRKDGSFFPVRYAISPILKNGLLLGAVLEFQDITDQKKLERDLTRAKEAAEAGSRAKMQFLANMSHEIRTPMNAILGFSEVLATTELSTDEKQSLESRIRANGDQLLSLINDILDLSKFEAGGVPLERTKCSVGDIVRETVEALSPLADRKELKLHFEPMSGVLDWAVTDAVRLRQILTNLIGNAIKFTHKGSVKVSMSERLQMNGRRTLAFQIEDTGIGISPEDQQKLFYPFSQADSSINRKFGGSGLGLVLSRRLAQALGGDLKLVHSQAGVGSCFAVTIDAGDMKEGATMLNQPTTRTYDMSDKKMQLAGVKILLAEDSEDNAALVRIYLTREGATIDWAPDGEQARAKALANEYDVVLMDVQMPCLDGLEATRSLRASGYAKPVIALTAHALKEEVDRSLQAGCNAHLTKPINRKQLIEEIRKFADLDSSAITGS